MLRIKRIDWGSRFAALEWTLAHPVRALKQIGAILASRAKAGMKDQGRPKGSWPERAVPNVPGILRDFHRGLSAPRPHRFESRPAVFDRGDLFRQIAWALKSDTVVEVGVAGSAQAYVDKQHFGGESETDPNTPAFKAWLWKWLKTAKGSTWKARLGYLLNKARLGPEAWTVRARPIFVITPEDVADIVEMTGAEIVAEVNAA